MVGDDHPSPVGSDALSGQVAIVSGAAGGLGVAWTEALRSAGATVVGFDIVPGSTFVADAADPARVRRLVDDVVAEHGRIDIAIANAAQVRFTSPLDPWDRALDDFDHQIGNNLRSVYLLGRAVAPVMVEQRSGHIINVSTDHVHRAPGVPAGGGPRMDAYDASKFAIFGLTAAWAAALGPHGIRVNELCMGATDGPMLRELLGERATPELTSTWLRPADLGRLLIDLLTEAPGGRTGQKIGCWVGHPVQLPDVG